MFQIQYLSRKKWQIGQLMFHLLRKNESSSRHIQAEFQPALSKLAVIALTTGISACCSLFTFFHHVSLLWLVLCLSDCILRHFGLCPLDTHHLEIRLIAFMQQFKNFIYSLFFLYFCKINKTLKQYVYVWYVMLQSCKTFSLHAA